MGFTAAVNKYFGRKPGQNMADFAAEIKQLDAKDREEMAAGLSLVLGEIVTPT